MPRSLPNHCTNGRSSPGGCRRSTPWRCVPRVSGYVDSVQFVEGARVRKGQLLFQIDPRPFQLEVDRLNAELTRAVRARIGARPAARAPSGSSAQNAIAREEYEQLAAARDRGRGRPGLRSRAQLDAARLNLEFTHVRSPIDGHVSRALITAGNLVSSASLLTNVGLGRSDLRLFRYRRGDLLRYAATSAARLRGTDASTPPRRCIMGLVGEEGYPHQGSLGFPRQPGRSAAARFARARCSTTTTAASPRGCSRASSWSAATEAGRRADRRARHRHRSVARNTCWC